MGIIIIIASKFICFRSFRVNYYSALLSHTEFFLGHFPLHRFLSMRAKRVASLLSLEGINNVSGHRGS